MLQRKRQGFTLLEILLVVALVAVLVGLSAPVYNSYKLKNDLNVATDTVAQSLYRAQLLAQAVDGDISWGVHLEDELIVVFRGASYLARNIDFDEEYEMAPQIEVSGVSDVVFSKFSGLPQSTGDIILTGVNNEVRTITINSQGMVQY